MSENIDHAAWGHVEMYKNRLEQVKKEFTMLRAEKITSDEIIKQYQNRIDIFVNELNALRAREKVLVEALQAAQDYATMMPTNEYHEYCNCTIACTFYNKVADALAERGK